MAMNPIDLYKALGDEIRLTSLLLIEQEGELCVCELVEALGESQPKVSRHLAQLRRSGILCDRRAGQWVYYSLHPQLPDWVRQILQLTRACGDDRFSRCQARLNAMQNRPDRSLCRSSGDA
jgi:ArsR family transcriptional regulator